MLQAAVAVAVLVGLGALLTRSRAIFHLSVRDGRVLVVSGRVPPAFLADVRQIVRRTDSGSVRAVGRPEAADLVCRGLDEGTAQRLRNVWRLVPPAAVRSAPAIRQPSPGQVLGVAWLAWRFEATRARTWPREVGADRR